MTACGAEFDWSERDGVVCDRAVDHHGPHHATVGGSSHEYETGKPVAAVATVMWLRARDAASERVSGACGDEQGSEATRLVRGRERRTGARGANEEEV